jgi:zinc protease
MIRRKTAFFLSIALLAYGVTGALAAPPAAAPGLQLPAGIEKRASVEGITEYGLPNGLRVLLFPDLSKQQTTVNITYLVGSRHEGYGESGMAHLLEHMVFKGTPKHKDIPQELTAHGTRPNGSTWYDRTNYYETLPAHHLDLGLWLESDRMGFLLPALTQETLDTQRGVVMNERRQRVDNMPYGRATERIHELLFPPGHPYHWPVIGYLEDLAAATLDDVRQFFRTYYAPNNAVLTLAGDLDPDRALRQVETWFGDVPPGPPVPAVSAPFPPLGGERREELEDDVRLPRVYLVFRGPAYGQRGWYAADLLAGVLAGGKSSVLYRDLIYERQIAQDVSAWISPFEEVGVFTIVATARPGVDAATLEQALLEHVERATATLPAVADLERARNRMLTEFFSGLQKLDNRADAFSQFTTFFDDPDGFTREPELCLGIEPRELTEYAAAAWRPDERVVVAVVPRKAAA